MSLSLPPGEYHGFARANDAAQRRSPFQHPRWHNLASLLPVMFYTPRHRANILTHHSRPNARMKQRPRHRSTANFKCFSPCWGNRRLRPSLLSAVTLAVFALCSAKDVPSWLQEEISSGSHLQYTLLQNIAFHYCSALLPNTSLYRAKHLSLLSL